MLSGCGSSSSTDGPSSPLSDAKPLKPAPRHTAKAPRRHKPRATSAPRVGTTRRINAGDTQLDVTIKQLIDPLRGSGASLPGQTHAVGVLVEIRNVGSAVYDSSATGDLSVVPSTGAAPPAFAPTGICQTQLRDFDNYITSDEVRDGCVVFDVRNGARVREVRFSPHARATGRAAWSTER
jgi:hypothetical protein